MSKESSKLLKLLSILIVIIGHYFRYGEQNSFSVIGGSIGFFGAAIFAFLSGYGISKSFIGKRTPLSYKYYLEKILGVYIPFIIVNFFSIIFIYKNFFSIKNFVGRIFLGGDDMVLWYVPYIIVFYILYGVIFNISGVEIKRKNNIFVLTYAIGTVALHYLEVGSAWYTSNGALILGVILAQIDQDKKLFGKQKMRVIYLIFYLVVTLLLSFVCKKFANILWLKDLATILAGMSVSISGYIFCLWLENIKMFHHLMKKLLSSIGNTPYWIYLLHMKIMNVINSNLIMFLVCTIVVCFLLNYLYEKFCEKIMVKA